MSSGLAWNDAGALGRLYRAGRNDPGGGVAPDRWPQDVDDVTARLGGEHGERNPA
jgi:hypothetical protein